MGRRPAGLAGPEPDEGQNLRGLLALAQVGVAVAEDPRVGILGQEGQDTLLPATPLGDVVLLDELVGSEERDRVEVQIEGLARQELLRPHGPDPAVEQRGQAPRPQPAGVLAEKGGLGHDVQPGPERQPLVEDEVHDVAPALGARQLEGEGGPDRLGGRDHRRPRQTRRGDEAVQVERDQPGQEHEQPTQGGRDPARGQADLPDVGDRRPIGARPLGPVLVAAPRQAAEPLRSHHLVNRREAQGVALLGQGIVDVVDRQVLLAQGHDQRAGRILLRLDLGPPRDVPEELAPGPLAEAVAKDPERARRIPKAAGRRGRGEALDEVGAQRLVLPLPRVLRLDEEASLGR